MSRSVPVRLTLADVNHIEHLLRIASGAGVYVGPEREWHERGAKIERHMRRARQRILNGDGHR